MDKIKKLTLLPLLLLIIPLFIWMIGAASYQLWQDKGEAAAIDGPYAKVQYLIGYFNDFYNTELPAETAFIEVNGAYNLLVGRDFIEDTAAPANSTIRDNYGMLHFTGFWQMPYVFNPTPLVKNTIALAELCRENGSEFLYVAAPEKFIADKTKILPSVHIYDNREVDNILTALKIEDINTLDLRELTLGDDVSPEDFFYRTDHHWRTPAAFIGYQSLLAHLNERFALNLDPDGTKAAAESYRSIVSKDSFIGSQGKRTGAIYSGSDDYILMLPTFETSYTVKYNNGKNISGDFYTALIDEKFYLSKERYTNRYASYLGADTAVLRITNNLVEDGRILIFKDSYAAPLAAFLSTCCHEMLLIDLRYFSGSVSELPADFKPDLTMIFYTDGSLTADMFSFD